MLNDPRIARLLILAPRLEERRFAARYGAPFDRYRAHVPYILPHLSAAKARPDAGLVPGPFTGLGPRGINRRFDLTFGQLPLTTILYMGTARKPRL